MPNLGLITAAELLVVALAIWGASHWATAGHRRASKRHRAGAGRQRGERHWRKSGGAGEPRR